MPDVVENLESQTDASTSPEIPDRFADDKSVDTAVVEAVPDPVEVEAEAEDVTEEPESEADSSPAVEEDDEETTEPDPDEYGKNVKDRVDQLTTNWRETERALEAANLEREELRRQLAERQAQQEPLKTVADFDYDDTKYQAYLMEENERRSAEAARQAVLEVQHEAAQKERMLEIEKAEAAYAEKHPDYFKVTRDPNLRLSQPMLSAVNDSEIRQDVLFHLAKNPDKAMSIFNLPDAKAGRKMGLLEAELKAEQAKAKQKVVSKAPPPVPKIKSGDAGLDKGYTEGMTAKQFAARRAKEIANR